MFRSLGKTFFLLPFPKYANRQGEYNTKTLISRNASSLLHLDPNPIYANKIMPSMSQYSNTKYSPLSNFVTILLVKCYQVCLNAIAEPSPPSASQLNQPHILVPRMQEFSKTILKHRYDFLYLLWLFALYNILLFFILLYEFLIRYWG